MVNDDTLSKLQHQLCELKLEERRVSCDIKRLVAKNQTIDFYKDQQLNAMRTGVKKQIKKVKV